MDGSIVFGFQPEGAWSFDSVGIAEGSNFECVFKDGQSVQVVNDEFIRFIQCHFNVGIGNEEKNLSFLCIVGYDPEISVTALGGLIDNGQIFI